MNGISCCEFFSKLREIPLVIPQQEDSLCNSMRMLDNRDLASLCLQNKKWVHFRKVQNLVWMSRTFSLLIGKMMKANRNHGLGMVVLPNLKGIVVMKCQTVKTLLEFFNNIFGVGTVTLILHCWSGEHKASHEVKSFRFLILDKY